LTVAAGAVNDTLGNGSTTTATAGTVVFQTVPGAPTAPDAGDATATVSWATPSVSGGAAVIGYRIEKSTNSGATWTTAIASTGSSATTAVITGLVNGTGVRFRIAAINTVGTSTASAATATVTPVAVTPPTVTPVEPGRVYESRSGDPAFVTVDGQSQGDGRTPAGGIAEIKVTGRANVKPDAEAVFLNVVAVSQSGPGFLTVFPCGTDPQTLRTSTTSAATSPPTTCSPKSVTAAKSVCSHSPKQTSSSTSTATHQPAKPQSSATQLSTPTLR
jgi:hypothetical protein